MAEVQYATPDVTENTLSSLLGWRHSGAYSKVMRLPTYLCRLAPKAMKSVFASLFVRPFKAGLQAVKDVAMRVSKAYLTAADKFLQRCRQEMRDRSVIDVILQLHRNGSLGSKRDDRVDTKLDDMPQSEPCPELPPPPKKPIPPVRYSIPMPTEGRRRTLGSYVTWAVTIGLGISVLLIIL